MELKQTIDEGLYSRQLYVLGEDAMKKMSNSNVLIFGANGLATEIAKNLALAGVKSVTLYDPTPAQIQDLGTHFFLAENDLGQPRAIPTAKKLAELNPYVEINVLNEEPTHQDLLNYKTVVFVDTPISKQIEYNDFTHANNICFIAAETRGLFSSVFTDFGPEFIVLDSDGEAPHSGMVANIDSSTDGVVTCLDETRHGLEDGDFVTFSEIKGMTALNSQEPRQIKVLGPYTFSIGDTTALGQYQPGGLFLQVKKPSILNFTQLRNALSNPEFFITDFAKIDRLPQIHLAFRTLHEFFLNTRRYPAPADEDDFSQFSSLAVKINDSQEGKIEIDLKLLKLFASQATGDLAPMNAVIGGFVAQEVLKSVTGKFSPLKNYMFFDSIESLPTNFNPSKEDLAPCNSRYDAQIAVFGKDFQQKIQNNRQFLVGAGAIGCEMLKNWALMGLGTGHSGAIHITDMDTIEKSNLNRQFLFRPSDLGHPKSQVAARAAIKMNPNLQNKMIVYQDRVGPESESTFSDEFFGNIDCVTNALDNMEARRYMDRRCVASLKPLLESGTLGSKGNTQVVVPYLTESYSASNDPPEKSIPMCTLHNFPNSIEHTIQWARDKFEGLFSQPAENANAYLSQPGYVDSVIANNSYATQKETFEAIARNLADSQTATFESCIHWARALFEELFDHSIKQLLFNFPKDSITSSGLPFWSPPKRAPSSLAFDSSNPHHFEFVKFAANLRAANYSIPPVQNDDHVRKVADSYQSVEFTPKSGVIIKVNDSDPDPDSASGPADGHSSTAVEGVLSQLPPPSSFGSFRMVKAEFEKDDDSNFHIDFITATSNLRAINYEIAPTDRFRTKQIAGKIIPAIATTTAVVSGLVCLELYKLLDGNHILDDYKNGFVNLALPFFAFSEPIAPEKRDFNGKQVSDWDAIYIEKNMTLAELIDFFSKEYKLEVSMITSGTTMLYSPFLSKKKAAERKDLKFSELVPLVSNKPIPPHVKYIVLVACANDEDDEDVDVPEVRMNIRN